MEKTERISSSTEINVRYKPIAGRYYLKKLQSILDKKCKANYTKNAKLA